MDSAGSVLLSLSFAPAGTLLRKLSPRLMRLMVRQSVRIYAYRMRRFQQGLVTGFHLASRRVFYLFS